MNLAFRHTFIHIYIAALISLLLGMTAIVSSATGQETKKVFVLNSFNRGYTWTDNMLRGIDDAFGNSGIKVETYVTFMDMKRIPPTPQHFSKLKELIKDGYKGVRFDAVLACDNDALEFLRKYRDELFPKVPVVFSSINDFEKDMLDGRKDITGTSENTDYEGTIRVALKLRPAVKNIVVVIDNTTTGKAHRSAVEKIQPKFQKSVDFTYLSLADMKLEELAQRLSKLDKESIVLLLQHFADINGTTHTVQQSTPLLTQRTPVPVFVLTDIRVGSGALGGHVVSGYHHGEAAAQMVVKILNGSDVGAIPVLLDSPNRYMFDYNTMQRFNISESDLPQGSIIINEPVSILHEYKPHLTVVVITFIFLCWVLVFLLLERTRRSKSERKLHESEERYRTLFTRANDGIFIITTNGKLVDVNASLAQMHGYSVQEMLHMSLKDFDTPETAQLMPERMRRILTGEAMTFEVEHYHKDGHVFPLEVSVNLFFSGGERYIQCIHRDITERKQSEAVIRESEERFRAIFEHSTIGNALTGPDGKLLRINKAFANMLGYTIEEISQVNFTEITHPDDIAKSRESVRILLADEQPACAFEKRYLHKNGDIVWVDISTTLLRDDQGTPRHFITSVVNRTKHKQAEEALREADELLKTAVTQSPSGILIASAPDVTIRMANPAALGIRGGNKGLLTGIDVTQHSVNWLTFLPDGSPCPPEQLPLSRAVLKGEVVCNEEVIIRDEAGNDHWVSTNAAPVYNEQGNITAGIVIFHDVTDRKQSDEKRKILEERLQRSEKMEALGQLAGGVAHDLNNVLGVTMSYAEMLQEQGVSSQQQQKFAEHILSSTQKAAAIIQDLLTLARRGVPVSQVLDLSTIISTVLSSPELDKLRDFHPSVIFKKELPDTLLNIHGSPVHLEKTMFNLLANAAEAISGKGVVTIRAENRYLDRPVQGYDTVQEGEYVTVSVSDTGQGIAAGELKKIFEPFYTKKSMGRSGTGLGLAIVWGTVKDHDGYIDVQSEERRGTTFNLYFPVTREPASAEETVVPVDQFRGNGEKVLVIDDAEGQRDIACNLLNGLGYEVYSVSSGEAAVEYLKENSADILVLDMIMAPGIDGLETYRRIRKIRPGQKAIIVSGYSETERVKEAQKLGAGAYVKKPYLKGTIGVAIRDELAKK